MMGKVYTYPKNHPYITTCDSSGDIEFLEFVEALFSDIELKKIFIVQDGR